MFSKGQLSHTWPYTYGPPRLQRCTNTILKKDPLSTIADEAVIIIENICRKRGNLIQGTMSKH